MGLPQDPGHGSTSHSQDIIAFTTELIFSPTFVTFALTTPSASHDIVDYSITYDVSTDGVGTELS